MVPSLPHPVHSIHVLLSHLCIVKCLVLISCLLLCRYLSLVIWQNSIGFWHGMDILAMKKVIDDLMAVLVACGFRVVWTHYTYSLICLIEALGHNYWPSFANWSMLHRTLHGVTVLPLYAKTRYRRSLLMIEIYLLLTIVTVPSPSYTLAWRTYRHLLPSLDRPVILRRYQMSGQR